MEKGIRAVFIDNDNTLLDFEKCSKLAMKKGLEDLGFAFRDEYYDTFKEENNKFWRQIEKGELTIEGLKKVRWSTVFSILGLDIDGESFEARFRTNLKETHEKMDGATELLEYLSKKYKVCVVTNAPSNQQEHRLQLAGLLQYIDAVYVSSDIGFNKPSREFFKICLEQEDLSPPEVVMIGDSLSSDIAGGIDSGLRTIWFNFENKEKPSDMKIDYVVNTLSEIFDIL